MNLHEYSQYDALGLAELLRNGETSARELGRLALDGVEKVNPQLNAVIEVYRERVDELDETTLPAGPFRGVPFMLKDLGPTEAGRKCESGSRLMADVTAEQDTGLTRRFRQAGLNLLGRTTTPELGITPTTESIISGATGNPWNPGRIAGGSSGGSGAIVAAGALPMAHANDGGGSIRIPAGINGLVGLKCSRGRVSQGPEGNDLMFPFFSDLAVSRSVRDTAVLLDAVAGPWPGEATLYQQPEHCYRDELARPLGELRVAVCADFGEYRASKQSRNHLEQTGRLLEDLGLHAEEATLAINFDEFWEMFPEAWTLLVGPLLDAMAEAVGRQINADTVEPITLGLYEKSRRMGMADQVRINDWMNRISRQLGEFFTRYDLLLTPMLALPTPELGTLHANRSVSVEQYFDECQRLVPYGMLNNATGTPAISLPLCHWDDGLPAGMHFMAPIGEEARLIRLAAVLEQAAPWADRLPGIHVSR